MRCTSVCTNYTCTIRVRFHHQINEISSAPTPSPRSTRTTTPSAPLLLEEGGRRTAAAAAAAAALPASPPPTTPRQHPQHPQYARSRDSRSVKVLLAACRGGKNQGRYELVLKAEIVDSARVKHRKGVQVRSVCACFGEEGESWVAIARNFTEEPPFFVIRRQGARLRQSRGCGIAFVRQRKSSISPRKSVLRHTHGQLG